MSVLNKLLDGLRARRAEQAEAASTSYEQLVRRLAADKASRSDTAEVVDGLLATAAKAPEDLERDVRAVALFNRRLTAAPIKADLQELDADAKALRAEAHAMVAEARHAAARAERAAVQADGRDALEQSEKIMRLAPTALRDAYRAEREAMHNAAARVQDAEALRIGWRRGDARAYLGPERLEAPSDAALAALVRDFDEAKAEVERAWSAVLEAAKAAPLAAVVAGSLEAIEAQPARDVAPFAVLSDVRYLAPAGVTS